MSGDTPRRFAANPFGTKDIIPAAPPLPTTRPLQRARDAATRFFGYQSRAASPQSSPEEERYLNRGKSRLASLGASQNATVSHKTGLEINTLAINEKGTHALIGGKEIFKTIRIENGVCAEEINLRSVIRSNPTHASGKARHAYTIDIADVAWAKGDCGDYVAAATSSGKIILYDLGRAGLQAAQLHEHFRQVHKVTFNPHRGNLLLSGSQDGTVRLWDVRDVRTASTLQSKRKYPGLSDGVRDVKWSPTEGVDFAFGTDSGWVQRWDMRNLKTAKVKIPAHSETCNAIDWHPDGKHIVSASSDKTVRVWDFSANRRQKASWEIKTPYRVTNARWRPSCESSSSFTGDGAGTRMCTQLVTSYEEDRSSLHIWDFRRPALPFRELHPYMSAPTDLLWHSQDLLWTVGREGVFLQSDIQHAPKTIDQRNLQAFALSPLGDISFATQKRARNRTVPHRHRGSKPTLTSQDSSRGGSPQHDAALARSWEDDGRDHSFLNAAPSRPETLRSPSISRTASLAVSPVGEATRTLDLDDALADRESLRPRQIAVSGPAPLHPDPNIFPFLASNYKLDVSSLRDDDDFLGSFDKYMEQNAACAYAAGLYRTAQTWRIVNGMMANHLKKRAELKHTRRLLNKPAAGNSTRRLTLVEISRSLFADVMKSPASSPVSLRPVSTITQQLAQSDVASDQRTPIVRPVNFDAPSSRLNAEVSLDPGKDAILTVDPPIDDSQANGRDKEHLTITNLDGLQQLQQTAPAVDRNAMVRRWSVQPKEPLNLDPVDADGVKIHSPKLVRQESNESFAFLEQSVNSGNPSFPSSYGSAPHDMVAQRPTKPAKKAQEPAIDAVQAKVFDDRPAASPAVPIAQIHGLAARPRYPRATGDGEADEAAEIAEKRRSNPYVTDTEQDQEVNQAATIAKPPHRGVKINGAEATSKSSKAPDDPPDNKKLSATYFPEDSDSDFEEHKPFRLVDMLRQLTTYYASTRDAQTAAHLLVALTPYLPRTQPLSHREATATVSVYIDAFLATASYTQPEIESLLEQHFEPLMNAGLQPLQLEAILATYHEQLVRRQMRNEAAMLRRLAYPMYPSVYEDAVKDNHVRTRCSACRKPVLAGLEKALCENCGMKLARCTFCESVDSPFEEREAQPATKLMSTCLRCNHGGHAACLRAWFAEGDGGCLTEGCLCDCVQGQWREDKARLRAEAAAQAVAEGEGLLQQLGLKGHERVQSDDFAVRDSGAVERARGLLLGRSGEGSEAAY